MVVIIVIAQCFSFTGTITTQILWYACEESCWGLAFFVATPAYFVNFLRGQALRRQLSNGAFTRCPPLYVPGSKAWNAEAFSLFMAIYSACFVILIFAVDVPEWAKQSRDQSMAGVRFFGFEEGFLDAMRTRHHSHDIQVWSYSIIWMSAYFFLAVQLSIEWAWGPRAWAGEFESARQPPTMEPAQDQAAAAP